VDPKLIAFVERRTFSAEVSLEFGDFITAEARLALNFVVRIVADFFLGETLVIVVVFVIAYLQEKAWKQRAHDQHSHHEVHEQSPIRKKCKGVLGTLN